MGARPGRLGPRRPHRLGTFSSAAGVALTEGVNQALTGTVLASDPPEHDRLRAVMSERLAPRALGGFCTSVRRQADAMVRDLVRRRSFDAVEDLAGPSPWPCCWNWSGCRTTAGIRC